MVRNDSSPLLTVEAERRHFCIVTETFSPEINGVALTLTHLIAGLRELGHSVSIVRPRQRRWGHRSDKDETLVHSLPLPGYRGLHIGFPAGSALRRCWSRQRPDAVYAATQGPLGWSAVRVAQQLGIPLFSGFHTNFDNYAKHYHVGWLRPVILRYLQTFHNRTAGTIVPSIDLRNRLRALGLEKVTVLGRGVDSRLFTPQKRSAELRRHWRAADSDLVVLYVGRLAAEKNLGLAVNAYRAMQNANDTVKFVLVGDGPLRSTLRKRHPGLIFSGVHTGEELARYYASADIFLFPSETETFGNVTLEAMASGLVVVAYDYAAAHLHVRNGETGVLARQGDTAAFVAAAVDLVHVPQRLAEIRRQARTHAASVDWQLVVERFAALLCDEWDPEDRAAKAANPSQRPTWRQVFRAS